MTERNRGIHFAPDGAGTVGYLYTERATVDNDIADVDPQIGEHNRSVETDKEGNVWGVEFFLPIEMIQAELNGKPRPVMPDVDLRGLSQYPNLPSEGELAPLFIREGLVPLVSSDLVE